MTPELETLDQLLGGDLPLNVIRQLYSDAESFAKGIHGLLSNGEVHLFAENGKDVEQWRWRELFSGSDSEAAWEGLRLNLTEQGRRRIA